MDALENPEGALEEAVEAELESFLSQNDQKHVNHMMVADGDVEVAYAPVLPYLKVPERKPGVWAPFKPPTGFEVKDPSKVKRLGGLIRKKGPVAVAGGFKSPTISPSLLVSALPTPPPADAPPAPPVQSAPPPPPPANDPAIVPLVLWTPKPPTLDEDGVETAPGEPGPPVSVDPVLCKFLREHQREGVQFMFDCVHGIKGPGINGCILADDMGLGKTLQSITLLLTVLRQGPCGVRTARRAIVVCPTSLVANWAAEIKKWVGDRLTPVALAEASRDKATADIRGFLSPSNTADVLIISYETFRIHAAAFHGRPDACDILICDEAHRLKNDATQTTRALAALACKRRVLLSGTPMQNDLEEFFAMVDFTNPGILGDAANFRRKFEGPILTGREPWATEAQKAKADEAAGELSTVVNQFILRRTNTLLSQHLPPKTLAVVCCKLTPLQQALYEHFLQSQALSAIMSGRSSGVLSSITALRKLVNHPRLIYDVVRAQQAASAGGGGGRRDEGAAGFEDCEKFFPDAFHRERSACADMSGKFAVAANMLSLLRKNTDDRIVIVSCYTQTLDLFSALCREHNWPFVRLDGSTSAGKRQKLVDQFCDPRRDEFVFLLSSRAGGCGLNLIGANRLILFDPDWNPATDLQAAARVWRDGQRKKVYVYRFLAAGTLEEKVFQRQLSKKGLQTIVVEEGDEVNTLSSDDLRNLFTLNMETPSDTHDMLRCTRCRRPEIPDGESDGELEAQAAEEAAARASVLQSVKPGTAAAGGSSSAAAAADADAAAVAAGGGDADEADDDRPARASKRRASGGKGKGSSSSAAAAAAEAQPEVIELLSDDDTTSDEASRGSTVVGGAAGAAASSSSSGAAAAPPGLPTLARLAPPPRAGGSGSSTAVAAAAGGGMDEDGGGDESSRDSFGAAAASAAASSSAAASASAAAAAGPTAQVGDDGFDYGAWASDDGADSDDDGGGGGRRRGRKKGGGGGKKGGAGAGAGAGAGSKRVRGGAPSKAAEKRASRAADVERKAYEAAVAAAVRDSMAANKLPPVPPGTVRRQLKWPGEDEIRAWSHHSGLDTLGDTVLQQAGAAHVSFVFSLEVRGRDLKELNAELDRKARERAAAEAKANMYGGGGSSSSSAAASGKGAGAGGGLKPLLGGASVGLPRRGLPPLGGGGGGSLPPIGGGGGGLKQFRPPVRAGGPLGGAGAGSSSSSSAAAPPRPLGGGLPPIGGARPGGVIGGGGLKGPARIGGGAAGIGGKKGGAAAGGKGGKKAPAAAKPKKRSGGSDEEEEDEWGSDEDEEEDEDEPELSDDDGDDDGAGGDADEDGGEDENSQPAAAAAVATKPAAAKAAAAGGGGGGAPPPADFDDFLTAAVGTS